MDPEAQRLRWRCDDLRRLADRIERTPLLALDQHAGPDTWRSPAADESRTELSADQARLLLAADDLRWTAWQFERRADELDAVARLATIG